MGAMSFYDTATGATPQEAFSKLVNEALEQYGSDSYNGTISTTELCGGPIVLARSYSVASEKAGYKYAEEHGFGEKWTSHCLDLGVCEYQIVTAKKAPREQKNPAKYETKYVWCSGGKQIMADTREKAEQLAMDYALKNQTDIVIRKQKCLVSGDDTVVKIVTSVRKTKTKPKKVPKGAIVKEIHMYGFYGWAAC